MFRNWWAKFDLTISGDQFFSNLHKFNIAR